MDGVSQTQPMSPEAINVVQDSDDEGDENGFGIVTFPGSRPAKRLKLMVSSLSQSGAFFQYYSKQKANFTHFWHR